MGIDNMAKLSINNETETVELSDLSDETLETLFTPISNLGDDDARKQTREELGQQCTVREFMTRYLELAKEDLLIG